MTYPASEGAVWNLMLAAWLFVVLMPTADELRMSQRWHWFTRFLLNWRFLLCIPIAFLLPLWVGIILSIVMIVIQFTTPKKTR